MRNSLLLLIASALTSAACGAAPEFFPPAPPSASAADPCTRIEQVDLRPKVGDCGERYEYSDVKGRCPDLLAVCTEEDRMRMNGSIDCFAALPSCSAGAEQSWHRQVNACAFRWLSQNCAQAVSDLFPEPLPTPAPVTQP